MQLYALEKTEIPVCSLKKTKKTLNSCYITAGNA